MRRSVGMLSVALLIALAGCGGNGQSQGAAKGDLGAAQTGAATGPTGGAVSDSGGEAAAATLDPNATDVPAPAASQLAVLDAWARPAAEGANTAVYLTLENHRSEDDRLMDAYSSEAKTTSLHETVHNGDLVSMQPVKEGIALPANGSLSLEPGGYHIMLEGLTRELKPGDTLSFVLSLEGYGNFATEAEVRPAEVTPAP